MYFYAVTCSITHSIKGAWLKYPDTQKKLKSFKWFYKLKKIEYTFKIAWNEKNWTNISIISKVIQVHNWGLNLIQIYKCIIVKERGLIFCCGELNIHCNRASSWFLWTRGQWFLVKEILQYSHKTRVTWKQGWWLQQFYC